MIVLLALRFVFGGVDDRAAGVEIGVCWWCLCYWHRDLCLLSQWVCCLAGDRCGLVVVVLLALRFVFAGVGECVAGVGIGVSWW